MNITQTTHSAKNVHGKNPWPSGDLNPGPLACGASALPTELPGRREKPGRTKYLQWYRGHGTQSFAITDNHWFTMIAITDNHWFTIFIQMSYTMYIRIK